MFTWLKRVFSKSQEPGESSPEARWWDYRNQFWGHVIDIFKREEGTDGQHTLHVMGFGREVSNGDVILLCGKRFPRIGYNVTNIEYKRDPSDLWSADLVYIGPRDGSGELAEELERAAEEDGPGLVEKLGSGKPSLRFL